jgi:N-acetylmuramoyl-L-alanine amidase
MKLILDAGHGGWANGKYQTDPRNGKLYHHPSFTFYEGVNNRMIAARLIPLLEFSGIDVVRVYHDSDDWSLSKRVRLANESGGDLYLSIHSNAGKGKGFEVYTTKGQTKSDSIAEVFANQFEKDFPEWGLRKDILDKDKDREQDFYVIKKTKMPAVLLELLFFDEENQAKFLMSVEGQIRIAESIRQSLLKIKL